MSIVDTLRQPEYTGENRCTPCTIANVAIAGIGGGLLGMKSKKAGGGAFAASLAAIYLRGYLVPGTPQLTKRYFPDRVLRWFDKSPTAQSISETDEAVHVNPEQVLLDSRAVTPCREGTDLCLGEDFQTSWRSRQHEAKRREAGSEALVRVLDSANHDLEIEEFGEAFVASTDKGVICQWPSSSAVIADVAAAEELAERYPDWEQLNAAECARVLTSLRIFIEECPECGGSVQVEQEVVESCCMSYDVIASSCQGCEAQLFEMEWEDETQPDGASSEAESLVDESPTNVEASSAES